MEDLICLLATVRTLKTWCSSDHTILSNFKGCGTNTLLGMHGETLDFQRQHQQNITRKRLYVKFSAKLLF